jgi:hypothetical protein
MDSPFLLNNVENMHFLNFNLIEITINNLSLNLLKSKQNPKRKIIKKHNWRTKLH